MRLFWNPEENRLRLVPRLVLFILLYGLLLLLALSPLVLIAPAIEQFPVVVELFYLPYVLTATAIATLASMAAAAALLDRRPFRQYGFPPRPDWWFDLAFGLGLGAVLMAGVFLAEVALGWVSVVETFRSGVPATGFWVALLVPLVQYLAVGVYEEALMRGYLLKNLAEAFRYPAWGSRNAVLLAWVLTSGIFALAHALNPSSSLVSTINLGLAGLFLGLGIVLTGSLAIPIGLHITWNFFQGAVFGFPVSGTRATETTVFAIRQNGPETWTGGAFGPEAGLIGLLAMATGTALTLAWVRWRRGRPGLDASLAQPPTRRQVERVE